jgi:hypothetical protein
VIHSIFSFLRVFGSLRTTLLYMVCCVFQTPNLANKNGIENP